MATGARHYGDIRATAQKWLEEVEIPANRIDDLPTTFSGGMQQAAAVVILSAPIVAHFTLPAVVARIFIVSPTVRVISVINRLLNIANGVVDNIGLGRNGGQREQGE